MVKEIAFKIKNELEGLIRKKINLEILTALSPKNNTELLITNARIEGLRKEYYSLSKMNILDEIWDFKKIESNIYALELTNLRDTITEKFDMVESKLNSGRYNAQEAAEIDSVIAEMTVIEQKYNKSANFFNWMRK